MVGHPVCGFPVLERLELTQARQSTEPVHGSVRECILDSQLPPGTKLSQAGLAEQLGALLDPAAGGAAHAAGGELGRFKPDRRMQVAGFDPAGLDSTYGAPDPARVPGGGDDGRGFQRCTQRRQARAQLERVRRAARSDDVAGWFAAHEEYHQLLGAGVGEALRPQLG